MPSVATRSADLVAVVVLVALALAFVAPAFPGTSWTLGADDALYFTPPFDKRPPPGGLARPSNALLADSWEVFHPDLEWSKRMLIQGTPPLWNPGVGAGWPQLASQQTALLFPLNLPSYLLPVGQSLGLVAALGIFVAALGMFLLARTRFSQSTVPAFVSAVAYACGSYFVVWLEHPHHNVYALIPWLVLTADRSLERSRAADAAAFAACVGLALLGGHPQSVFLGLLVVAGLAVWRMLDRPAGWPSARRRALAALAAGGVVGLAAGAVMLLPLLEMLGQAKSTSRGNLGGLPLPSLLTLALPDYWGRPDQAYVGIGPVNHFERVMYVGAPALLLAVAGATVRRTRAQWFLLAVAGLALVTVMRLPGVTWFVDNVPPFANVDMLRGLILVSFALALLAGAGLEALLRASPAERRRATRMTAAVAVLPLLLVAVLHGDGLDEVGGALLALPAVPGDPLSADAAALGAALRWTLLAAVTLGLLALAGGRVRPPTAAVLLAGLLVVDLFTLGQGQHPVTRYDGLEAKLPPLTRQTVTAQGAQRTTGEGVYLRANVGSRYGVRDLRVRGQPILRRPLLAAGGEELVSVDLTHPGTAATLDLFGVSQVLSRLPPTAVPDASLVPDRAITPDVRYRNVDALPRAYVATSWRREPDARTAARVARTVGSGELIVRPVVETTRRPPPSRGPGSARIRVDGTNRLELDATAPAPGRLVLLDTYYPGWSATVNGRAVPIAATNAAFRSVPVPAGASKVVFTYRPLSVIAGAVISLVAWVFILTVLGAWLVREHRRRRTGAAPAGSGGSRRLA